MEHYPQENRMILPFVMTWMDVPCMRLSKICQTEKDILPGSI